MSKSEFFNIYVDSYEGEVTAEITSKSYKGLICTVSDWSNPEDAFNKLKEACVRAVEHDFTQRHDKILKYIKRPSNQIEMNFEPAEHIGADSGEEYDECMACQ